MPAAIANTYRFFVPPAVLAGASPGDPVALADSDLAHQMGRVLRLRAGSRVLLLDGLGMVCTVRLTSLGRSEVAGEIEACAPAGGEPAQDLVLYGSLLRAERFEWLLQKGTEIGFGRFVPLPWSRTQAADRERLSANKQQRWQRIIREAAEQACRGRLPALDMRLLDGQSFAAACATAATADQALLLWEGDTWPAPGHAQEPPTPTLRQHLATLDTPPTGTIAVLSGPEGGITRQELTTAHEHGIMPVSLGPRILRAETAPLVAAAALLYALEG